MISDVTSYMAKLLEIQNSATTENTIFPQNPVEERFIIDGNTRNITVPITFNNVGVMSDHNAETIYFEIERYFDNEDLVNHTCVIQYINAGKEDDIYTVTKIDLSTEGKIIFGWTISNHVTKFTGDVQFAVRFYTIENDVFKYNFNTTISKFSVLNGLNITASNIPVNVDILAQWIDQLSSTYLNVNTAISASQSATEASISSTSSAVNATELLMNTLLTQTDIRGTTQVTTWNTDKTIQKVDHKNTSTNEIIRTDSFTYNGDIITEVRTMTSGELLTFVYDVKNYTTIII